MTEVLQVDPNAPDSKAIEYAAKRLGEGKLVAFPTETVYGLGANALDADAVERIFVAKGRPSHNPIIVHIPDAAAAQALVTAWPETAERLAERFWPGPLTLVLPRREMIPDLVTAGGSTVGLRVPAHPIALALLHAAGVPIAAPSANRSLQLSPTRAEHVLHGLQGRIDLLLDGGPTRGGLESTVLNLTTRPPTLLRPGLISPAEIEAVLGPIRRSPSSPLAASPEPLPSPGMLSRHYAPRAALEIPLRGARERVRKRLRQGERVGWLTFHSPFPEGQPIWDGLTLQVMPRDPAAYAARLYAALHTLDKAGVTVIVVDRVPDSEEWLAVRDRLRRAAA